MKIPKYILAMIAENRINNAPVEEQNAECGIYGYVFRLYLANNSCYLETLLKEANKVVKWAKREYAEACVLEHYNNNLVHKTPYFMFSEKEHRKPYYKRDYILLSISDPVAQQLEKLILEQKNK